MTQKIEIDSDRLIRIKSAHILYEHEWENYTDDVKLRLVVNIAKLMINEGLIQYKSKPDDYSTFEDYITSKLVITADCVVIKPKEYVEVIENKELPKS